MTEEKPTLEYGRGRPPMARRWRVALWLLALASLRYVIWFLIVVWYPWANSARE